MLIDMQKVRKEAEEEVRAEQTAKAKEKIKAKLVQIATAKTIVANLERKLDDLESEITQGN